MNLPSQINLNSEPFKLLIRKLERSRKKSNRDLFCLKCWRIYNYESNVKHKSIMPTHKGSIITSKNFASEAMFMQLARAMKKISSLSEEEFVENPYQSNIHLKVPSILE